MQAELPELRYNADGLIPCIVQDVESREVLMMAWMNAESLALTLECGETVFWSRSRQELWHKGATSGLRRRHAACARTSGRPRLPHRRHQLLFPHPGNVRITPDRQSRARGAPIKREAHRRRATPGPGIRKGLPAGSLLRAHALA